MAMSPWKGVFGSPLFQSWLDILVAKFNNIENGGFIDDQGEKTTPVDADYIGLIDTADSNKLKKLSWANIKATLKTYFDGFYVSKTVVDLTSAVSDYELAVGETAKITISAASTPLNIAVEDGVYEIDIEWDASTFAADQTVQLDINNTTYVGSVAYVGLEANVNIATDEVDARDAAVDGHRFTPATLVRPQTAYGRLIIASYNSGQTSLTSLTRGRTLAGQNYIFHVSTRMTGTPHTSLGTLQIGEAASGVCYVKRIA